MFFFLFFFLEKYCMYSEFNHIFFSAIFPYNAFLFYREVSSNKYNYCAIFVHSLSAYATSDRSKKRLVKDDLY